MCGPGDRAVPFWAAITDPDRVELRRVGRRRSFRAGSTMLRQHERSDHVIVMFSGCVKIVAAGGDGYQTVLALRGPGELLGELAGVDGRPRSATVIALTDVEALVIVAAGFEMVCRTRPAVHRAVKRQLSARLRESDRSLAAVGAGTTVQRLARTLLCLGHRYGTREPDGIRIDLPLSQDDLAGLTYTSLRTVGRILAEWRDAGWVSTGRCSLLLRDPAALDAVRSSSAPGRAG